VQIETLASKVVGGVIYIVCLFGILGIFVR